MCWAGVGGNLCGWACRTSSLNVASEADVLWAHAGHTWLLSFASIALVVQCLVMAVQCRVVAQQYRNHSAVPSDHCAVPYDDIQ